jgi:hypothetical protein
MRALLVLAWLLAADPFWVAKESSQWSEEELELFLSDSPWARQAEAVAMRGAKGTASRTFLATAAPMRLAEQEWRRRRIPKDLRENDGAWQEYQEFLEKDAAKFLVLAVAIPKQAAMDAKEMAEMENQSTLRLGKKKVKVSGYFPASESDPFTRLIFARAGAEGAKELVFELYVPGDGGGNFREAIYVTKEMQWKGNFAF